MQVCTITMTNIDAFSHNFIHISLFIIFSYEGTGRSLSLKLIQQLRQQNATFRSAVKTDTRVLAAGGSKTEGNSATGMDTTHNFH